MHGHDLQCVSKIKGAAAIWVFLPPSLCFPPPPPSSTRGLEAWRLVWANERIQIIAAVELCMQEHPAMPGSINSPPCRPALMGHRSQTAVFPAESSEPLASLHDQCMKATSADQKVHSCHKQMMAGQATVEQAFLDQQFPMVPSLPEQAMCWLCTSSSRSCWGTQKQFLDHTGDDADPDP